MTQCVGVRGYRVQHRHRAPRCPEDGRDAAAETLGRPLHALVKSAKTDGGTEYQGSSCSSKSRVVTAQRCTCRRERTGEAHEDLAEAKEVSL